MHRGFFVFLYGKGFLGGQRWNRWGRGHKGAKVLFTFLLFYLFTFLPFYFFTFLPLKAAAASYTECGSDSCEKGDCDLQNCFPGTCFHNL